MAEPARVCAFDVETANGRPFALGVSSLAGSVHCYALAKGQGLPLLAKLLLSYAGSGYLVGASHVLRFDLGVLIFDWLRWRYRDPWTHVDRDHVKLALPGGIGIEAHIGEPAFGRLTWRHTSVQFLDTFAYFPTSLAKAAKMVGLTQRKLPHPPGFGQRVIAMPIIRPYLERDVRLALGVAQQITRWWTDYEIRPAISAPQFASRVFRHRFVKAPWVEVPKVVERMALLSYHGGKNGLYTKPGWVRRAYSYDLRSAYCWAMTQIPDMTQGEWQWTEKNPKHAFGFFSISGRTPARQRYPVFFTHDFLPLGPGVSFRNLCVTSTELATMLRLYRGWKPTRSIGIIWRADNPGPSDLARYAREMWSRREAARSRRNRTEEELFKLLANSLYGKFVARTEVYDDEGDKWYRKGELFYAPVAAWITALVRCRITDLEHRFAALHTSTDGFITDHAIPRSALGRELGGLKFVDHGPLLLLRNKCYLHFNRDGQLSYEALHGFQGSARNLWRCVQTGRPVYRVERLTGWIESLGSFGVPFAPVNRVMRLHVAEVAAWPREARNPYKLRGP